MDQAAGKHRIGDLGHQLYGVIIHLLDLLEAHKVHPHLQGGVVEDPLKAEYHIIGVKIVSVGEFHALAELELPSHAVLQDGPALSQTGLFGKVGVVVHQGIVQVRRHLHLGAAVLCRRVQRDDIVQYRNGQTFSALLGGGAGLSSGRGSGGALAGFVRRTAGQGYRQTHGCGQDQGKCSLFHICFLLLKPSY